MNNKKVITVRLDISDYDEAESRLAVIGVTPEQAIRQFMKDIANGAMIGYIDALNTKLWNEEQRAETGYTLAEVCDILHITQRTAYRYIEQGKIHAVKEGKFYTVAEEELARILNDGIRRSKKSAGQQ